MRSVTEACAECRRCFTKKIGNQMMAPLPKSRLQSSLRVFEKVGDDYGGPFLTKQGCGRARAKRYQLCLFTYLTTRAVHLEMSCSLESDCFINAFTRITSRRRTPTYIILKELCKKPGNILPLIGSLTLHLSSTLVGYLKLECNHYNEHDTVLTNKKWSSILLIINDNARMIHSLFNKRTSD